MANITVNLDSPTGQTVDARLYGFGTGAMFNDQCDVTAVAGFQQSFKQLKPKLLRVNSASGQGPRDPNGEAFWESSIFANGYQNPDWSYVDPFFVNAPTFMASDTQLLVGIADHVTYDGGGTVDPTELANRAVALAKHFKSKGYECFMWEVWNEPDGVPTSTYNAWFNAVADALHSYNSSYMVGGPVLSFPGQSFLTTWANACGAKADFVIYHNYGNDLTPDDQLYSTSGADQGDTATTTRQSLAGTPAANLPMIIGEWNINGSGAASPRQQQIQGAVFMALALSRIVAANVNVIAGANWEVWGDGNYGSINDPGSENSGFNYGIYPQGYFLGQAGQVMGGNRVPLTIGVAGVEGFATVANGKWAIQLINSNTSGNASVTVGITSSGGIGSSVSQWAIGPGTTPTTSTTTYAAISGAGISLPNNSVMMLTGTIGTPAPATAPAGTVIGSISVQTSGSAFTGTLGLSGANAADFQVVGTNLETAVPLQAGTYSVQVVATEAGAGGSPFTAGPFTITGAPPAAPVESADGTTITTVGPKITDASGNTYAISSGGQVLENGTAISATANVVELYYRNHTAYQENSAGEWYVLPSGTSPVTSPIVTESAEGTAVTTVGPTITTAAGDTYSIGADTGNGQGQTVITNGTIDATTANVAELYYHNHTIYHENTSNVWYTQPNPTTAWTQTTSPGP